MKIRVRDIVFLLAAIVTIVLGVSSLVGNATAEDTVPQTMRIVNWFLSVGTIMYVVFAVQVVLRFFFREKVNAVIRVLHGAVVLLSAAYTVLVIIYASPTISKFIEMELWRVVWNVMTLALYIFYMGVGITAFVLAFGAVRDHTENQHSLRIILVFFILVSAVPTLIFSFQYQFDAAMRATAITSLVLPTVCQAITAYGVYTKDE